MKWFYLAAVGAIFLQFLLFPNPAPDWPEPSIIDLIVNDSGIPNTITGIIFRNRIYDTIFEVVVFTIAIMGCKFLLANDKPLSQVYQFSDRPSIVLARLGALISALVSIELAIRGHLSPGGGFAAGVAGGTAIGLVAITSNAEWMEGIYKRWRAALAEKLSVLLFIILAALTLLGFSLPDGEFGSLLSGGMIPIMNILVAFKVALGSWAAILLFIRYRGLF
ncbi:Na(+)/H(+) antiporter subunit B [Phormidium yuhuli AB48]|uniref:Na(+)/H(+) antiporter subunit B n=1 Tax=Phormidium yuhuli AB48 TaxID=2940671 RepID=A0ABY5AN88_9CYAN|nr:Na(+)/H(+) antiporter subunit B [Phormidium yuhuli]USR90674.1 Na(+)/H(+) antiporter subunit B [Phormidium yuhuli AB48]